VEAINFVFAKGMELIMVNTVKDEVSLLQCQIIRACIAFLVFCANEQSEIK